MNKDVSSFENVIEEAQKYIHKKESIELINNAYAFADEKHKGQVRKSGDPYISHLINVAYIVATLQGGPMTIAASLLHDTIEDCGVTFEELSEKFGEEVANLVESVTKVSKLSKNINQEDYEAENHRKLFIAMAKDIRVIIIKLADRLHNMRTLHFHNDIAQEQRIATETLKVYAPIAHRLGINTVKSELEDLSLKYLEPEKYQNIKTLLSKKEGERKAILQKMTENITELLKDKNIPLFINGRVKSIYSIYKKMYVAGKAFEQIYDLEAMRIITYTVTHCYEILGYIHASYRPIPGRFKDYIAMPKPNLYQSLHTTIVAEDGQIFEIQIRTTEMDEIAETGIAAHWRYKENTEYSSKAEQKEIEEKLHWFRDLISITDNADGDAKEYMDSLTKDIFQANVYCLTPLGRVIDLPNGATPVDFAYKIHTHVGHSTIGATVNGVLVPLSTELKTGDVVDIKTSKAQNPLPNEDWLKFVKTNQAKNAIRKALLKVNNELRKNEIIQEGREYLENAIRQEKGYDVIETIHRIEEKTFLESVNCDSITSLYIAIQNRTVTVNSIISKLKDEDRRKTIISPFNKKKQKTSIDGIIVPGIDSIAISFSQCCSPLPGDKIVGYIQQGKGVKIHRIDCPTIQKEKTRLIEVMWDEEYLKNNVIPHYADIMIKAQPKGTLLNDIINHLSLLKINCVSANVQSSLEESSVTLCIQVNDLSHLMEVINSLQANVKGIYSVERYCRN